MEITMETHPKWVLWTGPLDPVLETLFHSRSQGISQALLITVTRGTGKKEPRGDAPRELPCHGSNETWDLKKKWLRLVSLMFSLYVHIICIYVYNMIHILWMIPRFPFSDPTDFDSGNVQQNTPGYDTWRATPEGQAVCLPSSSSGTASSGP